LSLAVVAATDGFESPVSADAVGVGEGEGEALETFM
jgi:hypothetical protein